MQSIFDIRQVLSVGDREKENLMAFLWTTFFLVIVLTTSNAQNCGSASCAKYDENMINVHLVPHSHDDVGWLKTVTEYYYGSRNDIQAAGVQYILDSVVDELLKDPKRRYIQVETAFFSMWYREQTASMQSNVKKLVNEGRLQFTGGAWSMNDEAAVHYQSTIDQFFVGLKFLLDNFGECGRPRIGWQIDPFGHSREMASIFAQMGFDAEFFARVDYNEKGLRLRNKTAEMIWRASDTLGQNSEIFTGILYNHYSAPPGFCFDVRCTDDPINDGDNPENNVDNRVKTFLNYTRTMAKYYRTKHLMMPMGDDFNYGNANMNFKNMDKLIKYVNARQSNYSKVNVFYSTPYCYVKALHETNRTWPTKTQDFFPYSTDWHTYWTGYFTSRPTHKRFERDSNHFLQVVKQLSSLAYLTNSTYINNLNNLRHAMGIMQHHDAITGTEKQQVAYNYDYTLSQAINSGAKNARAALQTLTKMPTAEFEICLQLNISVCDYTSEWKNEFVITLYNPLGWVSTQYVRIPIEANATYQVINENGTIFVSQLVPIAKDILNLPYRNSKAKFELVFLATVDKLANYYVKRVQNPSASVLAYKPLVFDLRLPLKQQLDDRLKYSLDAQPTAAEKTIVTNKYMSLVFDRNGILNQISRGSNVMSITQQFYYYRAALGNNEEFKNRSSGAYIFRPNGTEVLVSFSAELQVYQGKHVTEVHQKFTSWLSQVIRLYETKDHVEFEWLVGPIPIVDGIGKEIITRFKTNINNDGEFWTDSNGREMLKRVRNSREYFTPNMTERVSGNYYPVTTRIAIEDNLYRLAILTDRSQGGSSISDGSVELMLHRRLLHDDAFGVGEALNETAFGKGLVARGKYHLLINPYFPDMTKKERDLQQELHLPFWKFFSRPIKTKADKPDLSTKLANFPKLPENINLLSLEPVSFQACLLRLENYMDATESGNITFNIQDLFKFIKGNSISEKTLDGNMALSTMKRFKFSTDGDVPSKLEYYTPTFTPLSATATSARDKFNITLQPMQIRTFLINTN